ncbi:alpha/beta fold hydrolase [Streptacidiphilus sp. EB129]|uniref:alpha/beta fold hydrolase n=1 Tax=Streptacidiphilus sp. EB129 TaxID=3156262 RepID=UPI00351152E2
MTARVVKASDGRSIAVETVGDPYGRPVFLLHGTPGSRLGQAPRGSVLHRLGIHLITFDRPGYGGSDRRPGRRVADAAADVAAVAAELGLTRYGVVGRSGGAPHALACAALLPDQVSRAAALISLAPRDAPGLDWYDGMAGSNVRVYDTPQEGRTRIAASLKLRFRDVRTDPYRLITDLRPELTPADRRTVAEPAVRRMLELNFSEALRHDAGGWIDDALAFTTRWGFDLGDIRAPVLLWHGQDDPFAPVAHSHWLAERIPNALLWEQPGAAHFAVLRILPTVLRWAAR